MKRITLIVFLFLPAFAWSIPGHAQTHNQKLFVEWEKLNAEVVSLHKQGRYDRAVDVTKKTLKIAKENGGLNYPSVATCLNNLAAIYRKTNRSQTAKIYEKRAAAIRAIKP